MGRSSESARLDLLLIAAHPQLSRRKAREVIEKGQVTVDGELTREPGLKVEAGAAVVWDQNRKALSRLRLSLPRLYEDETVLVVDKPAGLLTLPSAPDKQGEDTAQARVLDYVTKLHPRRRPYVGVVHRLDRDTSGALAFALTPVAREALRELFHRHAVSRRYLAIVRLVVPPAADHGTIELPVHADYYLEGRRRLALPGEPLLPAVTRYRVRERYRDTALVELELETGRQHQIRLHLAEVGMPVLGDVMYGPDRSGGRRGSVRRQMLHAWRLELTHPLTGVAVRAESPSPPDFVATLDALRERAPKKPASGSSPHPKNR